MDEQKVMVWARVLILAERREAVRQAAARLAAEGYEVQVAAATAAGLAGLAAPWPDLVLLCFDGAPRAELLAEVRCHWGAPLLVWAGPGGRDQAVRALQAGADDYVDGPLALEELTARVVAHLRRAQWCGPAAWQAAC